MSTQDALNAVLWGLAVGDAYGELFSTAPRSARTTTLPPPRWPTTDDTAMALAVADTLRFAGCADPDILALCLARRFRDDPGCGYGHGTRAILEGIHAGRSWRSMAAAAFGGQGSMGNGAAVRAAPIGGFYDPDNLSTIADEARHSARPTHTHPEAAEGAAAVAVAVAARRAGRPLFSSVLRKLRPSLVRDRIGCARDLEGSSPTEAARVLGCGQETTAQDTVPFALWMAASGRPPAEALCEAARVGGDTDTVCAIVGAIVGAPPQWVGSVEPWFMS